MLIKIPPPVIGLLCAGTMWLLASHLPLYSFNLSWLVPLAVLVAVIAVAVDLSALWSFRKAKTTINPLTPGKTSTVVTHGIYRYSRNPMYVGMLGLLIAFALYLGKVSPWLIPPLFIWMITINQIVPEEKALEQLFGEHYRQYKNTVRRWL